MTLYIIAHSYFRMGAILFSAFYILSGSQKSLCVFKYHLHIQERLHLTFLVWTSPLDPRSYTSGCLLNRPVCTVRQTNSKEAPMIPTSRYSRLLSNPFLLRVGGTCNLLLISKAKMMGCHSHDYILWQKNGISLP